MGPFAPHRGESSRPRASLSISQILAWADAFYARRGRSPQASSGLIEGAGRETWVSVDSALRQGHCGLTGGPSLYCLIKKGRQS
jgi:hypothetical protein